MEEVLRAASGALDGAVFCYAGSDVEGAVKSITEVDLAGVSGSSALLASGAPVILHERRFADGSRRITRISELCQDESGELSVEDIFVFDIEGLDEHGLVAGSFRATGRVPNFVETLQERGFEVNLGIFQE